MNKELIDSIYYHYEENNHYGLKVLIKFKVELHYLFFDSSNFIYINELPGFNWRKINYESLKNEVYIESMREDELVTYFIKLSNNDIFYIFQRVDSLEKWEQDFEIINPNSIKYKEITDYMNESWIEEIVPGGR